MLFETWAFSHNDELNYFLLQIRSSILTLLYLVKLNDAETKSITGVFTSLSGGFQPLWFR